LRCDVCAPRYGGGPATGPSTRSPQRPGTRGFQAGSLGRRGAHFPVHSPPASTPSLTPVSAPRGGHGDGETPVVAVHTPPRPTPSLPPHHNSEEGEGGDACSVSEKRRGITCSRVHRPDPQCARSRVHRPTSRNPVRDVYQARHLYSTTMFHLLARPSGMTAASPPRPHAPSRGAGS